MTVSDEAVWMTRAAHTKLQHELDQLTRPDRAEQEGDRVRIAELRSILQRAEISTKPDDGLVEPGMQVTVRLDGDQPESFLLGNRELIGSNDDLDVYSPTSPMGQAIAGHHVGDEVNYTAPNGRMIQVEILAASPYDQADA